MVPKTPEGKFKKELFMDGRVSKNKEYQREIGIRKQTKTKIKRARKAQKELIIAINS